MQACENARICGWGVGLTCVLCSFLDDIDRIATRTYAPSDDDVVRARLRTVGVQEYSLKFENVGACLTLCRSAPGADGAPSSQSASTARLHANGSSTTWAVHAQLYVAPLSSLTGTDTFDCSAPRGCLSSRTPTRCCFSRRSTASTRHSRRTGA